MKVIPRSFYLREDVVTIARDLLGKSLFTQFDGKVTAGIITETEAYAGVTDSASHAYGNRRTQRTKVMYSIGGTAYVYLCYGVHSLFNVVTNDRDIPHAILIRAMKPLQGIDCMLERAGKSHVDKGFGIGPGKVAKILGIHFSYSGMDLTIRPPSKSTPAIWLEDEGRKIMPSEIITGTRIGVEYAGKDALLPYRFRIQK